MSKFLEKVVNLTTSNDGKNRMSKGVLIALILTLSPGLFVCAFMVILAILKFLVPVVKVLLGIAGTYLVCHWIKGFIRRAADGN